MHFPGHKVNNADTQFVNSASLQAAIYLYFSLIWIGRDCNTPAMISSVQPICFTGYEIHTYGLMSKELF